ncbi:MAG: sigma-54 dependent transcriptional regulator [Planctomycetes bacterium]|nr:sigma-54 dependent transcriptional regulator [Planctomycetota bacterium]
MLCVFERLAKAAASELTVLLTGESGTGKELAARAIHELSPRHGGPFVVVNAGAIPRDLVASELFGHEAGSFTGALRRHLGKFETAHRGTLFLDEIAATDPATQVALLRALEERAVTRLGSHLPIPVDVRFIAATNEDLPTAVRRGRFREDLLYRLDVFHVHLPPLRERGADEVEFLARSFLADLGRRLGREGLAFDDEVVSGLRRHAWPGNVRELRNCVEQAAASADGDLVRLADLPSRFSGGHRGPASPSLSSRSLKDVERAHVLRTLSDCGGNKVETARALGISRKALYDKLARWAAAGEEP